MSRFEHLVFVCTNAGRPDDPKARCGKQGGEQLLERLKACAQRSGRKGRIRITRSGCLDLCARGCAAYARSAADPAAERWFIHLQPDDAERLFAQLTGEPAPASDRPPLRTL